MAQAQTGVNTKPAPKKYDLAFRQDVRHYIDTAWMAYLTPTETKVLNLLCARTIYWGKVWEVVTYKHMTVGCKDQFNGTGLARQTVITCLDKLLEEGFVRRKRVGDTYAYCVNVLAMGTNKDPVTARMRAHRVRLSEAKEFRIAKARAMRDLTRQYEATGDVQFLRMAVELGHKKAPRKTAQGGVQSLDPKRGHNSSVLRTTENIPLTGNVSERSAPAKIEQESGELINLNRKRSNPTKRASADDLMEEGAAQEPIKRRRQPAPAPDAPQAQQPTGPRIRRRKVSDAGAAYNPAKNRLINAARDTLVEKATTREPVEGIPAQARHSARRNLTGKAKLQATFNDALAATRTKQEQDVRKMPTTVNKLHRAWGMYLHRHYSEGLKSTDGETVKTAKWSNAHQGRMKSTLTLVREMPEPGMTWVDVMQWYITDYGRALQLAVPWMVKHENQREDLLSTPPRVSMFVHFAREFLDAYHRVHYGAGFTEAQYARADEVQDEHDYWMERRDVAQREGADALPADLRTESELMQVARDAAGTHEAATTAVRSYDAFHELDELLREEGATREEARREMDRAAAMVDREHNAEAHATNMDAVANDQREMMREAYGEHLTDEECDELLREMYEDEE